MAHYRPDIDISSKAAEAICSELDDVGELFLYKCQQFISAQQDRIHALSDALTILDPEEILRHAKLAREGVVALSHRELDILLSLVLGEGDPEIGALREKLLRIWAREEEENAAPR